PSCAGSYAFVVQVCERKLLTGLLPLEQLDGLAEQLARPLGLTAVAERRDEGDHRLAGTEDVALRSKAGDHLRVGTLRLGEPAGQPIGLGCAREQTRSPGIVGREQV